MNSVQFLESIVNWLLADPAHLVVAASIVAALTPTPDPNSIAGKLYRVIDLLALNVLRAKQTGSTPAAPSSAAPSPVVPAPGPDRTRQAGHSSLTAVIMLAALGASLGLAGCTGVQAVAVTANAQAVQAAMNVGKDQLTLGRELLCGAPYQVVANTMADDAAFAGALPDLCPATKSVVVPLVTTKPAAGN